MTQVIFTIPGKPFGKQRPRFSRKSGTAYTPGKTVSYERQVAAIAAQHFKYPFPGPVMLEVYATFTPAKSWSKKNAAAHLGRMHTHRPDADNLQKAILDALNRIAYADDSQVAEMRVRKVWGPEAKTVVTVTRLETDCDAL